MLTLPPLSLYIHIPWCEKKCPYCDFNSHTAAVIPEASYFESLKRDLDSELQYAQGRSLRSIFIGGGTPSLMQASSMADLLVYIQANIAFDDEIEITMEANPGSSEQEKFADLRSAGVNRLSIGVQSFNDLQLQAIGRVHSSDNAKRAITAAQQAGFERINIDLMHGLPGQSLKDGLKDLDIAINAGVEHISWYQLTIEQNTAFFRYPPTLPKEAIIEDIQDAGFEKLLANGFEQYEISAFSNNAKPSKHNMNYWQFGDYLAIGAGAHGKITMPAEQYVLRYQKTRSPDDYLKKGGNARVKQQTIVGDELVIEALMNCLRLNRGMCLKDFLAYTGSTKEEAEKYCQQAINKRLMALSGSIQATEQGRKHLNSLLASLG